MEYSLTFTDSPAQVSWEVSQGYTKTQIDHTSKQCPNRDYIYFGEAYNQRIYANNGTFKLENSETQTSFQLPTLFPDIRTLPQWLDLTTTLEEALVQQAEYDTESLQYLTYSAESIHR